MSLATYSDLQAAIANWSERADLQSTGANFARVDEFITLAEKRINRSLSRIGAGEVGRDTSLTTTSNVEWVALPAGFNAARSLQLTDGSRIYTPDFLDPEEIDRQYPNTSIGLPRAYTVLGTDGATDAYRVWFKPIPDAAYTLRLTYYKLLATLVGGSPSGTNWMLTNYPDAYLQACLLESAIWLKDAEAVQGYMAAFNLAFDDIKTMDKRRRYTGAQLSRAPSVRLLRGM